MPRLGPRPMTLQDVEEGFHPRQCEGRCRATGFRCRLYAIKGRRFCRVHGGRTKRGKQHPNYRDGYYCRKTPDEVKVEEINQIVQSLRNPRPIQLQVVLYPETLADRIESAGRKGGRKKYLPILHVPFETPGTLPPLQEHDALMSVKKAINERIRELRSEMVPSLAELNGTSKEGDRESTPDSPSTPSDPSTTIETDVVSDASAGDNADETLPEAAPLLY